MAGFLVFGPTNFSKVSMTASVQFPKKIIILPSYFEFWPFSVHPWKFCQYYCAISSCLGNEKKIRSRLLYFFDIRFSATSHFETWLIVVHTANLRHTLCASLRRNFSHYWTIISSSTKKLSLYIHIPKYLFGIWIWATKN